MSAFEYMRTQWRQAIIIALSLAALWGLILVPSEGSLLFADTQAPSEDLIAYWPFDEGSGEVAQDVSGNGHDGDLKNGPEWVEGIIGQALRFDGFDDFVLVPYSPDFSLETGLTIALWAYLETEPDVTDGNDWRLLLGRSGFSPYGLLIEQNGRLNGTVYIGSERQEIQSDQPLPLEEWTHIVFTYDAESGLARLYLNGEVLTEAQKATGSFRQREGRPLTISLSKPQDLEEVHSWPGVLDEIYFYKRALRPEEVQALYQSARP